jgi:hypothetical protein
MVCLKVSNLRIKGIENLEAWMADANNVYTGRRGRIFIHQDGVKRIFNYKGSKWQNPFTLKEYSLKKSLQLYVIHLFQTGLIYDIDELKNKSLGCFCSPQKAPDGQPSCHAQILADLIERCYTPIEELIRRKNKTIQLVPSIFTSHNRIGDFGWMIKQPAYDNALFIFNDNEDAFLKHSCARGGGNAVIRPYQCKDPPRSTGISTGYYLPGKINAGYSSLNDGKARQVIDHGIQRVKELLKTGRYKRIIYSGDKHGGLGTGIFVVGEDVKKYIVSQLKNVV